jgi:hypothetical protein
MARMGYSSPANLDEFRGFFGNTVAGYGGTTFS